MVTAVLKANGSIPLRVQQVVRNVVGAVISLVINMSLSRSRRCAGCLTRQGAEQPASFAPKAIAILLSVFAVCLCNGATAGCGAGQANARGPAPGVNDKQNVIGSGNANAAPTSIAVEWEQDSCVFSLREGVGATYRFAASEQTRVQEQLHGAIMQCSPGTVERKTGETTGTVARPPLHGVVYIRGIVAPDGTVGQVQVTPSGTVSTSSAECLRKAVMSLRLGQPREESNVLLVTLVGACGENWLASERH